MDLNTKDTNQLENIRTDELIGLNPTFLPNQLNFSYTRMFADWMSKCDECKRIFRNEHQSIYYNMYVISDKEWSIIPSWLDYYKGVLILEIRDIKLKKIIN